MTNFERALDDRAKSFLQVGDVARIIAEKHTGVTVDATTHTRWRELMGLLREVDTLHDDTETTGDEILKRLDDFSEFTDRYPSLAPNILDNATRSTLLARTRRIMRLGHYVTASTTPKELVELRVEEGRETANFLADTATPFVDSQPAFQEKYMPVMRSMAITANLLDSLLDSRMDAHNNALSQIPDLRFYATVARHIPRHAKLGSAALVHPAVMREFAIMSWHRLNNRIKHRNSATSSLALFTKER